MKELENTYKILIVVELYSAAKNMEKKQEPKKNKNEIKKHENEWIDINVKEKSIGKWQVKFRVENKKKSCRK